MLKSCYQSKVLEAGCDEVGRGCIAGPVVAASVIFPNDYSNESIKDSKTISPKKRILIEKEIKSSAIAWSVSEIDNERKELINKRLIVILPSFGERYLSTAMFESNTSIQARKDGYL